MATGLELAGALRLSSNRLARGSAMSGIGLTNALLGYQQGVAWKQQQDEIARQRAQRDAFEAANREALTELDADREDWVRRGAPGTYSPSETTMYRIANRRGMALAKAGLVDQFMSNQAQVAPMRLKARAQALKDFEITGDAERFMRAVAPTMPDGLGVIGSEQVNAPDDAQGLAAVPTKTIFKFSDGTTKPYTHDELLQFVAKVKGSLVDPATSMKNEAEIGLKSALAKIETDKWAAIAASRGKETRDTEATKFGFAKQLHDADNASREKVAAGNNAASANRDSTMKYVADANASRGGATSASAGLQALRATEVGARAAVRLASDRLKNAKRSERDQAQADLNAAIHRHSEILKRMDGGSGGGSSAGAVDNTGDGDVVVEMARAEAVSSGQPVQFDLGGRKGQFAPNGALNDARAASTSGQGQKASGGPLAGLLKEGIRTTFKNGQVWTLRNGKPERVN